MSLGRFFVIVLLCVIAFFVATTGGPIMTGTKATNTLVLSQQVQLRWGGA